MDNATNIQINKYVTHYGTWHFLINSWLYLLDRKHMRVIFLLILNVLREHEDITWLSEA